MRRVSLALTAGFLTAVAGSSGTLAAQTPAEVVNDGYGDYVLVPAGPFTMGDTNGDGEARERPAHSVTLDGFYIGKYEVTNAEWRRFIEDPEWNAPRFWPDGLHWSMDLIPYWTQANNHGGGSLDSDGYPVIGVNWDAAMAYCRWLSEQTGHTYRLPTEAEWEKAARGTDTRRFPWGDDIDHGLANFVYSQDYDTVMPVGYFDGSLRGDLQTRSNASPYGVFDMAGNVMEWTADWYDREYYARSPTSNPDGPEAGAYRVLRGGAFNVPPSEVRVYGRSAAWPSFKSHRMVGFRPVREP